MLTVTMFIIFNCLYGAQNYYELSTATKEEWELAELKKKQKLVFKH